MTMCSEFKNIESRLLRFSVACVFFSLYYTQLINMNYTLIDHHHKEEN
jgi:hypothetical protein